MKQFINLDRQVANVAGSVKLEMCHFAGQLSKQMGENLAQITLRVADSTNAIQVESLKNAAMMSKEMAECCCEIKELIIERTARTNELVQQSEANRIRDDLERANQENLLLKIKSSHHHHL